MLDFKIQKSFLRNISRICIDLKKLRFYNIENYSNKSNIFSKIQKISIIIF